MDNFMDKLVEKINAQGTMRNQNLVNVQEGVVKTSQTQISAIENVLSAVNDGNARNIELITEYKKQNDEVIEKNKEEIMDHVHKESVKCYRNMQAVVEEKATMTSQSIEGSLKSVKGILITILVFLILNFGATIILILRGLGLI
ncbi:MAG: hypothetical protein PHY47_06605 [Lachnospiraceae bacterium]|nr:hypothetical protein [Lachnospiraceae bacterium]